jgi:TolB-like protein/DNA-binding winged helix-turn-helix (wHTH) protein
MTIAKFGVFELNVGSGELRRSGIRVPLQDQPVRLLALLLEHAGEVVSREEVRAALWPQEFVDFDHSLNTAVRKLRAALDDSADNPRFVETLAKRGYRFIAPVSWNGTGQEAPRPHQPERAEARSNIRWLPVAVVVAILMAGAAFFLRKSPAPVKNIDSIAVLPFWNGDRETQHINDGLTEILIDTISRLPDLRVMAPTTVFRYKDTDPLRAGKDLGVTAVVSGHIRHENDRYVVRVELIDVGDGAQLWASHYDASPSELPSVQSRIAGDLASALRRGGGQKGGISASTSPEVYELYTKGLYAWNRRDLPRALQFFNGCVTRDPTFAPGYAGLANTYGVMVGYGQISVAEGTTKIISNAQKALDLDPNNAEALVCLASTKYRNVWDFAGADADYRRAIALNPNYATGHEWYADLLRSTGRWDEARREIDVAYKLDPFSGPIMTMKCFSLYYERRYREAIAFADYAAAVDPQFGSPLCRMHALTALGQQDEAAAIMRRGMFGLSSREAEQIAQAYDKGGRTAMLRKWLAIAESNQAVQNPVGIAIGYANLGERDRAFMWLEKAYEQRVSAITNINVEPQFDVLHDDPRWDALLKRIGLPHVLPPPRPTG